MTSAACSSPKQKRIQILRVSRQGLQVPTLLLVPRRHTTYEFRSVIVPPVTQPAELATPHSAEQRSLRPYSIRMSARDHRAMANAFLELFSMDAEATVFFFHFFSSFMGAQF